MSAEALFDEIQRLSQSKSWQWLIKFHPKMDKQWVEKFKSIQHDKLTLVDSAAVAPLLQTADVILSDTSSIITEFLLLEKPAVTFNNSEPEDVLIDITEPSKLEAALELALSDDNERVRLIKEYNTKMHPYQDGKSGERVLEAAKATLRDGKKAPKALPRNWFRNLKMRRKIGYWGK
jgi:CDP-glycerol glycerophosphotransferase (TagB/SpsB family)